MARVAGINIPDNKHIEISLTYIFGIGKTRALGICDDLGIAPSTKILIIEDVLSTGGSLKEVINLINNHDADIVGIGVVVDRSSSNIDLHKEFFSITKQVANIFDPENLPDTLQDIPAVKPGSNTIDV